jgi:transaldolase
LKEKAMPHPLQSIIEAGSKLWLDSVDPKGLARFRELGLTGATSNPVIIADLVKSGQFDQRLQERIEAGDHDDEQLAWHLTDHLVKEAQATFEPVWQQTGGNDGYVSFELDPLLEDAELAPDHATRVQRYIELGKHWANGHRNRMIKVPATEAGLEALEPLAAAGVTLNVTLIFTKRQYEAARDAIWRGAQQLPSLANFKSVYSIFISRVDVYTEKHVPELSEQAQGQVGLVNAKRLWHANEQFWADKPVELSQEIVFASTGTKKESDPADKYVAPLVGSGIQTNPPETMEAVHQLGKTYQRSVENWPEQGVLDEIDQKVDMAALEHTLMEEGKKKFADPHKALLELIGQRRQSLTATG